MGRVGEILDLLRPQPGQPDLRNFEWSYLDRLRRSELLTLKGHTNSVTSVAFSPDSSRLASASFDTTAKLWDAMSGKEMLTLKGHSGPVNRVVFDLDGKRLVSASQDGTVKAWDTKSGLETLTFKGHTNGITSMVFSTDGKRLASANQMIEIWDARPRPEASTPEAKTR